MSGKPQYDEAAVIDAALGVFWRHGYAAASLTLLTEATGLSRSSLYQRFGDKDGLFQEALAIYTERVLRRMHSAAGGTRREQLDALLRGLLPGGGGAQRPPGCLLARSCAELVDLPQAGQQAAVAGANRQRDVLRALLDEAVAAEELPAHADLDALAWHFLGVLQAVLNLPQAGATADMLDRMIDAAMLAWPVPVASEKGARHHASHSRKPPKVEGTEKASKARVERRAAASAAGKRSTAKR